MELNAAFVCDRGLSHKRPVNEDRALVLADRGLFVVCDGVGGHSSGDVASQLAVDTIEEALEHLDDGNIEQLLRDAVQYANRDIYEMASSMSQYEGMGTTVALLYLDRDAGRAIVGHAGDSRVYRFDGESLHRETYDHTDLDDAIRAGRITPKQALALGKQNTINRALGIEAEVQAEFKTIPLVDGEAFLLTSDGVTRHIDDEELEELLAEGLEPDALCEEIRQRCYARGAEDNLTAVVVYTGSPRAQRRPESAPLRSRIELTAERSKPPRNAPAHRPAKRGGGLLGASLAIALAALAFFAGRASTSWLAWPRPPAPPASAARDAFERGDLAAAREAFTRLSAQEPGRADYHYWLGRTALAEGDAREAALQLEQCVKADNPSADAYLYLAAAYNIDNRPKEATDSLKKYADALASGHQTTDAAPRPPATGP